MLIINQIDITDMKKILMFLTGLVTIGLFSVSCSKDEMNERNLEGKWQSTKFVYEEYEAGKLVGEKSQTCIDWYLGFNFKSDGTGQYISYEEGESYTCQLTWVIMGDKLMVTLVYTGDEESDTLTFNIVEIASSSMTLSMVDEYTSDGVKCKDVETYYFKKI